MKGIYKKLAPVSDPTVDLAMAEALPTAAEKDQIALVLTLIGRGHPQALASIVRHLHLLPKLLQKKLLGSIRELEPGVRIVAAEQEPQVGLNLIHLIVRSRCYHLAYLLSVQLQKENNQIHRAASAGLLELAWGLRLGAWSSDDHVAIHVRSMDNALSEALSSYHKHHQHIVLMAAAALAPTMSQRLSKMLSDRLSKPYAHLRQIIPRMDHPMINRAILFYAGVINLRPIIVEALRSRQVVPRLDDILFGTHMLCLPRVRATVRKVTSAQHLLPDDQQIQSMQPDTLRSLPLWIATDHTDHIDKARVLSHLIGLDDPMARLLAMRVLMGIGERSADEQLVRMCLDENPAMARCALRHLMLRQWPGLGRLMELLLKSQHSDLRDMAERYLLCTDFRRLWERWDGLENRLRVLVGMKLMRHDPEFQQRLLAGLHQVEAEDRFKSIMMIRQLRLAEPFRNELIHLIHDEHPRVGAAAVAALGPMEKPPRFKSVLLGLLKHPNDRMRANAIEALQRTDDLVGAKKMLGELAASGQGNRSRACAIAALWGMNIPSAREHLNIMLGDPRPKHRCSAIWVVEKFSLQDMRARLELIHTADSDPKVRRAAERALDRLSVATVQSEPEAEPAEVFE